MTFGVSYVYLTLSVILLFYSTFYFSYWALCAAYANI